MIKKNTSFLFFFLITVLILFSFSKPAIANKNDEALEKEKDRLLYYLSRIESKKTGLYQSYTNSAHYIEDIYSSPTIFMKTIDGYLDNQAFTYDQALALMGLIHAGKMNKARYLLTVFQANFETEKNGRTGLLNSYLISNFDYFIPTEDGKRLLLCMGIDGDRIHVGPNVWIGLGALQYYAHTGSPEFIPFAIKIFTWTRMLNHYAMPDGSAGAVCMGYGWGAPWNQIFSTENNIDYYALIINLIKIYKQSNPYIKKVFHASGIELLDLIEGKNNQKNWMTSVGFNHSRGTFNRGANLVDDPDTVEALDCTTWGIAGFGPAVLEKMGIDTVKLIKKSEEKFFVQTKMKGKTLSGFDFTDKSGYIEKRKQAIIWFEGTGQMALTYRIMSEYCKQKNQHDQAEEFAEKYTFYIDELDYFMKMASKDYGLPCTSSEVNEKKLDFTFFDWWPIVRTEKGKYSVSLSSTLWRYFAVTGFNPFEINLPSKTIELTDLPGMEQNRPDEKKSIIAPEHISDYHAQTGSKSSVDLITAGTLLTF